jgi:hypothetical protein
MENLDIGFSNDSLDMSPNSKGKKSKNRQIQPQQTRKNMHSKENNKMNEKAPMEQEQIFVSHLSHKGFTS